MDTGSGQLETALVLAESWRDGRVKQRLIADLLGMRKEAPALFEDGGLVPVMATGARAEHVLAFTRGPLLVAVATRLGSVLAGGDAPLIPRDWWGDTVLRLSDGRELPATELLTGLPYAVRRMDAH